MVDDDIKDLCQEVIAELLARPTERFYAAEFAALNLALRCEYRLDQHLLDWLFDLRRVTEDGLEGRTVTRYPDPGDHSHDHETYQGRYTVMYRRWPMLQDLPVLIHR